MTIPLVSAGSRGVQPEQSSWCFAGAGRRWVAGAEARPPHASPQERLVSPPWSLYIFISQNKYKFPFLERIEWQIPYLDIFTNRPGGFCSPDKIAAISGVRLLPMAVGWVVTFPQHEAACTLRCCYFAVDSPALMNPFAVTCLSVLFLYLILQIPLCRVMAKGFQA